MNIVLHAGAHCTDDDRLLKTLFKNKKALLEQGVALPKPRHYRQLLNATIKALAQRGPGADSRMAFLDAILEEDPETVDRVIMNAENFFCVPKIAISKGRMYPKASSRVSLLPALFQGDQVDLCLAMRNPATHLPAMYAATPHTSFVDFMDGSDARDISWAHLIEEIRTNAPNVRLTVWCNEDTPLIWGELVRELAGLTPSDPISGGFDLLDEIMSREGMKRFYAYLETHPDMTEMQTRRVISAFLDKFALDDMVEEELDLPGWTESLIEELTDNYEEDIYAISRMPGVNLIAP